LVGERLVDEGQEMAVQVKDIEFRRWSVSPRVIFFLLELSLLRKLSRAPSLHPSYSFPKPSFCLMLVNKPDKSSEQRLRLPMATTTYCF